MEEVVVIIDSSSNESIHRALAAAKAAAALHGISLVYASRQAYEELSFSSRIAKILSGFAFLAFDLHELRMITVPKKCVTANSHMHSRVQGIHMKISAPRSRRFMFRSRGGKM
jgi:hypothetical protein